MIDPEPQPSTSCQDHYADHQAWEERQRQRRQFVTNEELFDAFRQVVSERDQLRAAGDALWDDLTTVIEGQGSARSQMRWAALRGIGGEPPVERFREWLV